MKRIVTIILLLFLVFNINFYIFAGILFVAGVFTEYIFFEAIFFGVIMDIIYITSLPYFTLAGIIIFGISYLLSNRMSLHV